LFPPENIGTNPNVTCPNGQVLGWTGDAVDCTNPTPGVTTASCPAGKMAIGISGGVQVCANPTPDITTVTCPSGQAMTGISGGVPVCVDLVAVGTSTPTPGLTVSCPTGQVLTGIINGAAECMVPPSPPPPVAGASALYAVNTGPIIGVSAISAAFNQGLTVGGLLSAQTIAGWQSGCLGPLAQGNVSQFATAGCPDFVCQGISGIPPIMTYAVGLCNAPSSTDPSSGCYVGELHNNPEISLSCIMAQ